MNATLFYDRSKDNPKKMGLNARGFCTGYKENLCGGSSGHMLHFTVYSSVMPNIKILQRHSFPRIAYVVVIMK